MGRIRKQYSPSFKAKVVLELLKETRSVSELSLFSPVTDLDT